MREIGMVAAVGVVDRVLLVIGGLLTAGWLAAVGVVRVIREPRNPRSSPETMDLGPETPAVANLLTRNFRVRREAVPATLFDLAARGAGVELEQTRPGAYACRLRLPGTGSGASQLTPYEKRVLDFVRRRAVDGVVPAGALTTGPEAESRRWFRSFRKEVVDDAQARGLCRDLWDRPTLSVLYVAAAVPAVPFGLAGGWGPFWAALAGGPAVIGAIAAAKRQRETPAGLEAGSRWLGVRAKLAHDEVFPTLPPTAVATWERFLAFGAAFGVARAAVAAIPMGAESDRRAWSAYGGEWHDVRVRYPRFWPPGWGMWPPKGVALGLGGVGLGGLLLYLVLRFGVFSATQTVPSSVLAVLVPVEVGAAIMGGVLLSVGALVLVMSAADLRRPAEVVGEVVRLRARGDADARRYVAVDDGRSSRVMAWRVGAGLYARLEQGEVVRAEATRFLGYVRSIEPAGSTQPEG